MAFYQGNDGSLKVVTEADPNGTPGAGTTVAVGQLRNFTIRTAGAIVDTTSIGDAWDNCDPGRKSWEMSGEAHYDPANAAQADILEAEYLEVEALVGSSPAVTLSGTAIVTSWEINNSHEDETVKVTFSCKGKNALTRA